MAKLTAIIKGVEKAGEAAGALKRPVRTTDLKGDLSILEGTSEYERTAGELDKLNQAPATPKDVREEIGMKLDEFNEQERIEHISPEFKDVDYNAQAATPEEFSAMVPRFGDPDVASVALVKGSGVNISSKEIIEAESAMPFKIQMKRWEKVQNPTLEVVLNNKGLIDWASQGAYTRGALFGADIANADAPVIWYRMDIRQDPRADLSPIQFDPNAREFGMHVGSRSAGQHIISPKVTEFQEGRIKDIRSMFDELREPLEAQGIDPTELFQKAFEEVRVNMFLRYGEKPFETPTLKVLDDVVDDFFETLKNSANAKGIEGLDFTDERTSSALFKSILSSIMRTSYDPLQHPLMTNVKKGLFVQDLGPDNTANGIAQNLLGRGIFSDERLTAILDGATNADSNIMLRDLLRENGYDHLVYVNAGEDVGVPSIVLFDQDNYQNLYKPTIGTKNGPDGHKAATAAALAPLAIALGLDDADTGT